jgi:hypothetical protein
MVLFSVKNIEKSIVNKTITIKHFVIYLLFSLGGTLSLIKTSKYPVNIEAYNIAYILSFVPFIINIIKYYLCYKIIKGKNIYIFLYSIIPLNFVINFRYYIFVLLPLIIININLIKFFHLDFVFWNVVNSQIISIVYSFIVSIHFIIVLKKIMMGKIDIIIK